MTLPSPATPPITNHPAHARAPSRQAPRMLAFLLLLALVAAPMLVYFRTPASPTAPLAAGTLAPDFSLRDSQLPDRAAPVTLSHLTQTGPVVVIFNMGLHCPACAQDLAAFTDRFDDFKNAGIQIIAISHESPADTRENLESSRPIPYPLLSDPDNQIARAFGLASPDGTIDECTFLIDPHRRILWSVKPDEPGGEIPHLLDLATQSQHPH